MSEEPKLTALSAMTTGFSQIWTVVTDGGVAIFKTLPAWADLAILAAVGMWWFGVIDLTPRDKPAAVDMSTIASKSDIAELKALIASTAQSPPAATVTGSVKRK